MDRCQVVGRKSFWLNQKKKMLQKSDGKCSHCGISIDLKNMTVEHVIPLSKGGTNELSNTVALCSKCNKIKRNYVTEPQFFYTYIKDEYKVELEENYKKFLDDFDWISLKSYFKNDVFNFNIESLLKCSDNTLGLSRSNKKKLKLDSARLQKVVVSLDTRDFDVVIDFCNKYGKRVLGLKEVKLNKSRIYEYLRDYAIYGIKSSNEYSGLVFIKPEIVGFYEVSLVIEMLPLYESSVVYLSHLWLNLSTNLSSKNKVTTVLITPKDSKVFEDIHNVIQNYKKDVKVIGANKIFGITIGEGEDFCIEKFGNIFIGKLPKDYSKYSKSSDKVKYLFRIKEWLKFKVKQSFPLSLKVVDNWSFTQCILGDERMANEAIIKQIYSSVRPLNSIVLITGIISLIFRFSWLKIYITLFILSIIFISILIRVVIEKDKRDV